MSKPNIDRLCLGLLSTRIKERSEAVSELVSISDIRLAPKEVLAIALQCFTLVGLEKPLVVKGTTSTAEKRVEETTSALKRIVSACVDRLGLVPSIPTLRIPQFSRILRSIEDNFFVESGEILAPSSYNFLQLYNKILSKRPILDHTGSDNWQMAFNFATKIATRSLHREILPGNTSICTELASSLLKTLTILTAADPKTGVSLVYLPSLNTMNYAKLFPLILEVTEKHTRSLNTILYAFQIINKLIITSITEDSHFAFKLAVLGLKLSLTFFQEGLSELQSQILIFLNLTESHTLLKHYSDYGQKMKITYSKNSNPQSSFIEKEEKLIHFYLTNIITVLSDTARDSIHWTKDGINFKLADPSLERYSFFALNSITYDGKILEWNRNTWLSLCALVHTMHTYFIRKLLGPSLEHQTPEPRSKKQRIDITLHGLRTSGNVLNYCQSILLTNRLTKKDQILGTQLLLFYYQLYPQELQNIDYTQRENKAETSLSVTLFEEVAPLDTLQLLLKNQTDTSLYYLAVKSYLDVSQGSLDSTVSIFNRAMLDISNKEFGDLACQVISQIIMTSSDDVLHAIAKPLLKHTLEDILAQVVIKGPSIYSSSSFVFWRSLVKLVSLKNIFLIHSLEENIYMWFLDKWNLFFGYARINTSLENSTQKNLQSMVTIGNNIEFSTFRITKRHQWRNIQKIQNFMLWLMGFKETLCSKEDESTYIMQFDDYLILLRDFSDLRHFLFKDKREEQFIPKTRKGEATLICTEEFQIFKQKIIQHYYGLVNEFKYNFEKIPRNDFEEVEIQIFQWLLFYLKIEHASENPEDIKNGEILLARYLELVDQYDINCKNVDVLCEILCLEDMRLLESLFFDTTTKSNHFKGYNGEIIKKIFQTPQKVKILEENLSSACHFDYTTIGQNGVSAIDTLKPNKLVIFLCLIFKNSTTSTSSKTNLLIELLGKFSLLSESPIYNLYTALEVVKTLVQMEDIVSIKALGRAVGIALQSPIYDRSEVSFVVASSFLRKTLKCSDKELASDREDIKVWLESCYDKKLINSFRGLREYVLFLAEMEIEHRDSSILSQTSTIRALEGQTKLFDSYPNVLISSIGSAVGSLIRMNPERSLSIYRILFNNFGLPQRSPESFAAYAHFLCEIALENQILICPAVFNVIEYCEYELCHPVITKFILQFTVKLNLKSTKELFSMIRFGLLKLWITYKSEITSFPYLAFSYGSLTDFFYSNATQIVSLMISSTPNFEDCKEVVQQIASTKDMEVDSLIVDCFSSIVVLSYTKNGIKNKIHSNLKLILRSQYSDLMRSQLLLISLDIFKYLDVSDEEKVSAIWTLDCQKRYTIVNIGNGVFTEHLEIFNISVTSGFELLKSVIAKVYKEYSLFWTAQTLYFLTRRLTALLSLKVDNINTIRRIKVLLTHNTEPKNKELSKLLVESFSPYLCKSERESLEIQNIWAANCFYKSSTSHSMAKCSLGTFILIVSSLIKQKKEKPDFKVLNQICRALEEEAQLNLDDRLYFLLMEAVKKLAGIPNLVSIKVIERVILNKEEVRRFLEVSTFESLAVIADFIFPQAYSDVTTELTCDSDFYETLALLFRLLDVQKLKLQNSFINWCAIVTASLYTNGYFKENDPKRDFHQQLDKFSVKMTKKDLIQEIFKQSVDLLAVSDLPTQACIESVIGIIIGKFANNQEVMTTLLPSNIIEEYNSYIAPLDYKMGIILQKEMQGVETLSKIQGSHDTNEESKSWAVALFIELLAELGVVTSITSAFSILAVQCEAFCEKALPFIISLYIETVGKRSISHIHYILEGIDVEDKKLYELYLRIILAIRIGSRNQGLLMSELYARCDLSPFINFALKTNSPKTALLLFEDHSLRNKLPKDDLRLLRTIYDGIGYDDLKYGLPADSSLNSILRNIAAENPDTQTPFMLLSGKYDAELTLKRNENKSEVNSKDIHGIMQKSGVLGISRLLQKDYYLPTQSQYEASWRLGSWDLPEVEAFTTEDDVLYSCLKQIAESKDLKLEPILTTEAIFIKLFKEKQMLSMLDVSNCKTQEGLQTWLRSLSSVSSIWSICEKKGFYTESDLMKYKETTKWVSEVDATSFEPILVSRRNIFQIFAQKSDDLGIRQNNGLCLIFETVRLFQAFKHLGEQQKILNTAVYLNELVKTNMFDKSLQCEAERLSRFFLSTALWEVGQEKTAISMMKELQNDSIQLPFETLSVSKNQIRATLVDWMSSARHERPGSILSEYVVPIYDAKEKFVSWKEQTIICEKLGKFCEEQHRKIDEGISKLKKLIRFRQKEIEELKSLYGSSGIKSEDKKSIHRYYVKLKAQYQTEVTELETSLKQKDTLAEYSVEFYLKSILNEKTNDSKIDKFFSLWLEFSDKKAMNLLIRDDLLMLPAYLLVEWGPQLISRLAEVDSEFQKTLNVIIEKLCQRHPYHSLYNLFSLAKHESSAKMNPTSTTAAKKIWSKLKTSTEGPKMINEIEKFCEESINLAKYKSSKGKSILLDTMGAGYSWFLEELPRIPPPTIHLRIDMTSNYVDVPLFDHVDRKIVIATSGLSLPKIATFYLNNGLEHKILFKHGSDDLRQDSIMEQVFEKVNVLFKSNIQTRKRKLSVRTYKAIPLGPSDGLIEFVSNSMAFIDVIRPYHKNDSISADKAREMMKGVQTKSKDVRRKTYEQITKSIKPVLREFFMDTFLTTESWFESRIMYSKGVATSSIVGYILGLGDRHCNNILLDKSTGEPIHIDLGVAFDQGKVLPIPETVPFRLTRDIVDGFGVTGTDGVFSLSCEHTFSVLRQNREHIIAILDVLRWDPLYSWSISPVRKSRLQKGEGTNMDFQRPDEGSEATRSISKVNDKLGGNLSVESMVNELIQEATDYRNLSLIYCGWCPFY